MNVLTLLGSPRKDAASSAIAQRFNEEAAKNGAQVTTYRLNDLDFKGCQGCYACKKGLDKCVINDDLTPVLEALSVADAVVFATPIYFGDITAQLKGFFDRLYSTFDPDYSEETGFTSRLPAGKKALFIYTQGAAEDIHAEIPERYNTYLETSGFTDCRVIRDCSREGFGDGPPASESMDTATTAATDFTAK